MNVTAARSLSAQASSAAPAWSSNPATAANQAINRFSLKSSGWRGFDAQPWVKELSIDYPQAIKLASSCSSHAPVFEEQAHDLFSQAPHQDAQRLQDYFVGKAGLEELSCRNSGAGARLCDKRIAYFKIYEISQQYVKPQPYEKSGLYI